MKNKSRETRVVIMFILMVIFTNQNISSLWWKGFVTIYCLLFLYVAIKFLKDKLVKKMAK
ncbi:hypothetical protein LBR_10185 [Levilactobacillus brevis]|nr:hypothetical protein BGC39_11520 [Levilactobacillus brevis]ORJ53303.1 hypothetical protein LBR_10185 [Levilactobacillus brevis]